MKSLYRTPKEILNEDLNYKPGGAQFDLDCVALNALSDNRGRRLTFDHLKKLQMGDKENQRPICAGTIPRLTQSLSVLYRVPASRVLSVDSEPIADDAPDSKTYAQICEATMIDNVWQLVDYNRNLMRQCVLSFVESHTTKSISARLFKPYEIARYPTPSSADNIEDDEHILFLIRDHVDERRKLYQLWSQDEQGWRMWIVDGSGAQYGEQPYGEGGRLPFDELPLLMIYDSIPLGQAYLPIPESRLDFALNINALANDLLFIVKNEGHSQKVAITEDRARVAPTATGADKIHVLPVGSDMKVLAHSPQIDGIVTTLEQYLSMLALGESLPGDIFSRSRTILTGPGMKAAERDLEARRQSQGALGVRDERRAFAKMRSIYNHFAGEWNVSRLSEDLQLQISYGRQWQPVDPKELQEVYFKDLSVGAGSIIGYIMERYNCDRPQAVRMFKQFEIDRKKYVVLSQQNPAALIDGQKPAVGNENASKNPGAFNPDIASSVDGASVTAAAQKSTQDPN